MPITIGQSQCGTVAPLNHCDDVSKVLASTYTNLAELRVCVDAFFAFFLARHPQGVLLDRVPPFKPCANENFPYPLVILRLGATLKHNKREKKRLLHKVLMVGHDLGGRSEGV
jgi:hypothetical protein